MTVCRSSPNRLWVLIGSELASFASWFAWWEWALVPTLRAYALRSQSLLGTALAPTSTVAMLAKFTPTLAREATWVWSQEEFRALEALRWCLLIRWTSKLGSSWSTAPLASSKSERAAVMPSLALKVDRSIASEAAFEIDPWRMPSWPKVTFSSVEAWRIFSHGWESILPWTTLGSAICGVSLSSSLIYVTYDPNC